VYHYESVILSVAIQEHRLGKDYHKVQMLEVSHQDALLITEKREQKVPQVKLLSATNGIYPCNGCF
jgi:hypothetical protein